MTLTPTEALVFEKKLLELGYKKYFQNFQNSDYCFWKQFENKTDEYGDEHSSYQIGFAFYDFSKYHQNNDPKPIHVGFHFLLGNNAKINRLDITISDDKLTLEKFEEFCKGFYEIWLKKEEEMAL